MENEKLIKSLIKNIKDKDFSLYFFVMDTKGNPSGGVANIYQHVKVLNSLGYDAKILHENNDYTSVVDWLGEEYSSLTHVSIADSPKIKPEDFLIIPEIFSNIMHDLRGYSCKKIVFSQNYHYILELLTPGTQWTDYGFNDVITTSESQADYIKTLFPLIETNVVPIAIPSYFKESDKPQKPIVGIVTREQGDALKIAKSFYLKYPMLKWVSFKEFRNLDRETFAKDLSECCLTVWVDDIAGHGTFPLESLECGVPSIVKVPNLLQDWMGSQVINEETQVEGWELNTNFIWTRDFLDIPNLISNFLQAWMSDEVPQILYDNMVENKGSFSEVSQKKILDEVYQNIFTKRVEELHIILNNEQTKNTKNE